MTTVSALDRRRIVWPDIRRGGRLVLRAHEVIVPGSGVVGIIGINGAGKSTLMLHLADLLASSRQHRTACSGDNGNPPHRTRVGFAPQHASLPSWLTAGEVAHLFGLDMQAMHTRDPSMRLDELIDTHAGALSAGQQQAVSVSIALAGSAPLVLLDEPFAPLDFRRRVALAQMLRRPASDRVVLLTTQSAAELAAVCSSVLVLREGRCVLSGPVAALTGPGPGGEQAIQRLEERLLDILDEDVSDSRTPTACHPP